MSTEHQPTPASPTNLPLFHKKPPQSGVAIDQEDVVELQTPVDRPCIVVSQPGFDILLSRRMLEAMAAHAFELNRQDKLPEKNNANCDHPEKRLEILRGARAQDILDRAAPSDTDEHLRIPAHLLQNARYLVGQLLENGLAEVMQHDPDGKTAPIKRIKVHYFGSRASPTVGFGFISFFAIPEQGFFGPEFFNVDWWVS